MGQWALSFFLNGSILLNLNLNHFFYRKDETAAACTTFSFTFQVQRFTHTSKKSPHNLEFCQQTFTTTVRAAVQCGCWIEM